MRIIEQTQWLQKENELKLLLRAPNVNAEIIIPKRTKLTTPTESK
jgi:hypothetical protein